MAVSAKEVWGLTFHEMLTPRSWTTAAG